MTETPIAAALVADAAPLPPFTPAPLPKSGYADPTKVHRKVPFENPVVFEGKTYGEVYVRKLTVAQVRVLLANSAEKRARGEPSEFIWPVYVDEQEDEIPDGVVDLLPEDEFVDIVELSRDCIPRRFRDPPKTAEATSSEEKPNASGLNTGKTIGE